MATKRSSANTSAKRRPAARGRKKKPELSREWSIALLIAAVLAAALTYVQGESGWAWARANLLFGVFGPAAYLLAPALGWLAVRVSIGQPVKALTAKLLLGMALLCGLALVFSGADLTGLSFQDGMIALHQAAAQQTWPLSGGVLSALFGWSLLALLGRPGANIVLVVLAAAGVLLLTNTTPGDLYFFVNGKAAGARRRHEEARQRRAEQMRLNEAARREAENRPQPAGEELVDHSAYEAAKASRRRAAIDIDLGEDQLAESAVLHEEEKPVIGPGGTFGMFPPRRRPQPAAGTGGSGEEAHPQAEVQLPPTHKGTETPLAPDGQPVADEPSGEDAAAPAADEASQLADLVRRAVGAAEQPAAASAAAPAPAQPVEQDGYAYPPLSLFQKAKPADEQHIEAELTRNADLLVKTLESFGVHTRLQDISRGPAVTRYELQPQAGVKISRITGLSDDIALNLATGGVRIEAPIPGKAAVGIEIPNKTRTMVTLRSVLESQAFSTSKKPLTFAVGMDIAGNCVIGDLAKMPHLLIAGTTGSGKSVCTNSIIMSFLYRCAPQKLRMILIDPKMVEFAQYNGIPHLLMPVVTEPRKAAGALGSAVAEMEKRYHLLAENSVPNIEEYNALAENDPALEPMPYIVIVIDELADLMMVAGKEVEDYICRIAQKARAAGMHLIVATQRPSVDVITGLIKANIPSRIGLTVMSQVDSRTILDTGGAEKLLGNGDMLYMPVGVNKPLRVQGTFVRSAEIRAVIEFIKKHAGADYNQEMIAEMEKRAAADKGGSGGTGDEDDDSRDPMFATAVEVVIDAGMASTSLLQRRCKLGYARAARIMDEMEQQHIIGPYEGSKPRQVLIDRAQWIEMTMQQQADRDPNP